MTISNKTCYFDLIRNIQENQITIKQTSLLGQMKVTIHDTDHSIREIWYACANPPKNLAFNEELNLRAIIKKLYDAVTPKPSLFSRVGLTIVNFFEACIFFLKTGTTLSKVKNQALTWYNNHCPKDEITQALEQTFAKLFSPQHELSLQNAREWKDIAPYTYEKLALSLKNNHDVNEMVRIIRSYISLLNPKGGTS